MNIVVAIKHIPSIADDLPVKGNNVDFDSVDFVLNEWDEHSIEQAVLIKEAVGGTVTVVGVDLIGELDNALHLALGDLLAKLAADLLLRFFVERLQPGGGRRDQRSAALQVMLQALGFFRRQLEVVVPSHEDERKVGQLFVVERHRDR